MNIIDLLLITKGVFFAAGVWSLVLAVPYTIRILKLYRKFYLIAVSMLFAVVVLFAASLFGYDVAAALWAVTVPLAGLGGYSYVNGKIAERAAP